jgi:hypothetical protein
MNDALRQAAAVDPDWARKESRRRMLLICVTVGALVAIGVGTIALVIGVHNETRITHVERTACADAQADPTDNKAIHECQVVRAAAERTADQNVNCIPFRRAGYICPKPGSPLSEEHRAREIREAVNPRGEVAAPSAERGDATSAPTGHSIPAPGNGGGDESGVAAGGGGHKESPEKLPPSHGGHGEASPAPTSESPSQSTTTQTTEREVVVEAAPPEAAPKPVGEGVKGVLESTGATVEGLGETVGVTVEGVEATTCTLAKVLC